MKDTVIKVLVTASKEHEIRISGTPDANTLTRYRDAVEGSTDLDDVTHVLEDEGAGVLCYDVKGSLVDSFVEWVAVWQVDVVLQDGGEKTKTVQLL